MKSLKARGISIDGAVATASVHCRRLSPIAIMKTGISAFSVSRSVSTDSIALSRTWWCNWLVDDYKRHWIAVLQIQLGWRRHRAAMSPGISRGTKQATESDYWPDTCIRSMRSRTQWWNPRKLAERVVHTIATHSVNFPVSQKVLFTHNQSDSSREEQVGKNDRKLEVGRLQKQEISNAKIYFVRCETIHLGIFLDVSRCVGKKPVQGTT